MRSAARCGVARHERRHKERQFPVLDQAFDLMKIKHRSRHFFSPNGGFIHTGSVVRSSIKNYSRQFFAAETHLQVFDF
jgi:hypothetical protein